MKLFRKAAAAALSAVMCILFASGCSGANAVGGKMRDDVTTSEIVKEMGLGINLGNTFECSGLSAANVSGYETAWGSPIITQEMIKGYAYSGFGTLRIPVAWSNMMGKNYEINPDYLARVKTVVEWALDDDLYVIMNIHWDGGWFDRFADDEKRDDAFAKYKSIWTQLTEAFKDYGERLIFESLNEEGGWEKIWNRYSGEGDKEKSYGILNDINQRFVNIVRGSGGNNEKRHLLIAGYNTDVDLTCDELYKMPDDPAGRCAVSVHYYTPSNFTLLERDASWGKARTDWGSEADYDELNKNMDKMKEHFVDKGIPVIVGECGTPVIKNKTPEMIHEYVVASFEAMYSRGMCPVLWDVTDVYYNRTEAKFNDAELLEKLMAVKN